ncbi:39S ribosomal protein L36, mitochondrial [Nilaparvata lugens]|uniref:39S ribosomal protein L36, mitochondrial n=1 Tax=Nilaparvata lugens TaxID=108931 RepID=UPI00193D17E4|nr:39S ribosomal protein L36, mitochondrial [Nilaparvata lugens]XP_039284630.1 39S ribosomal protein L36, mitochondrial [Nilaparvata lugens]
MNTIFKLVQQKLAPSISRVGTYQKIVERSFHAFSQPVTQIAVKPVDRPLLSAGQQIYLIPCCGFKYKDVLKKRCRDCFVVVKDRQAMVLCNTHPRHKMKRIMPKEKDTWIVTHHTTGKFREW